MDEKKNISKEERQSKAKIELHTLEKEVRSLQNGREVRLRQDRIALCKQRILLKVLENEKSSLENKVTTELSNSTASANVQDIKSLKSLLKKYETLTKSIADEKEQLVAIESKIKEVVNEIEELDQGYKHYDEDDEKKNDQIIENLEIRLEAQAQKFNQMLVNNRLLRSEINTLMHDRERFNHTFLEKSCKLQIGKIVVLDLIDKCTKSYDKKQEYEGNLSLLKADAMEHLLNNALEFEELVRNLFHATQMNEFIGIKGQGRLVNESNRQPSLNKEETIIAMEHDMEKNRRIISSIKDKFSENNADRLVMLLMKLEEDNYNLYRFINEQNKRIDIVRENVCDIHHRIFLQNEENKSNEISHLSIIENGQDNLEKGRIEVVDAKTKLEKSKVVIHELLSGIQDVFYVLSCDSTALDDMLGDNATVGDYNVQHFLLEIERRLQAICTVNRFQAQRMTPRKSHGRSVSEAASTDSDISMISGGSLLKRILTMDMRDAKISEIVVETPCLLCDEDQTSKNLNLFCEPLDIEETQKQIYEDVKKGTWSSILHSADKCKKNKSRRSEL